MSEQADSVAILIGDDALRGDSGEAILLGDSSSSQQQEMTIDHGPHTSIDELLKVIKGANDMPVLFVPSSDGRLAAVAVNGLQNLMPANRDSYWSGENKEQDLRAWLLLLASLAATITFTVELTPPGGFWSADDKANGYVAGTPVMRQKFPSRYNTFQASNATAFICSLMIIGMLAKNLDRKASVFFPILVGTCFLGLGVNFLSATWDSFIDGITPSLLFGFVFVYVVVPWVWSRIHSARSRERPMESSV